MTNRPHNLFLTTSEAKLIRILFSSFHRVILMYFFLPETENRSLEDIEFFFSDRNRKITDVHIRKNAARDNYLAKQKALEASEVKHQS